MLILYTSLKQNTMTFCFMFMHRCPSTVGTGQYGLLQVDNISGSSNRTVSSSGLSQSYELREPVDLWLLPLLGCACAILIITTVVLLWRVRVLRKRPRIRKRVIVNKNVTPLTACHPLPQDQCEITIENCCNMNICETVST
jgi:hypothetical protein